MAGSRLVTTDLYPGEITSVDQLREVRERLEGDLDSLSEMGEMESLRLQMAMDRLSKLMSTLSNLLKAGQRNRIGDHAEHQVARSLETRLLLFDQGTGSLLLRAKSGTLPWRRGNAPR